MDLYLIRHAHAADGALYGDDYERPLTAEGRRAAQAVGAALQAQKTTFEIIVSSPLVRAVETAELLACQLGFAGGLTISRALTPDSDVESILQNVVAPHRASKSLALVGHQPSMGQLVGSLVGRSGASLQKGAVVCVDFDVDSQRAKLRWVITPESLDPSASL